MAHRQRGMSALLKEAAYADAMNEALKMVIRANLDGG